MTSDMHIETSETVWLNDAGICSIEHLSAASGLSPEELREMVDSGAIAPADAGEPSHFHLRYIVTARMARRLRDDFELDRHGVAMAVVLLQRIERLERQLQAVRG